MVSVVSPRAQARNNPRRPEGSAPSRPEGAKQKDRRDGGLSFFLPYSVTNGSRAI